MPSLGPDTALPEVLGRVLARLRQLSPKAEARAWFVPGRIEVAGKHTDYAGGRSLIAALERGFWVAATARWDGRLRLVDAAGSGRRAEAEFALGAPAPPLLDWALYPAAVGRRLARDYAPLRVGADVVFSSDLPPAAGLSSSTALVIATWFALAAANGLSFSNRLELAGYLAAVESGRAWGKSPADGGVGTHGGSEDHTAILCARPGELSQYSYCPTRLEARTVLPADWIFAIGASGVAAHKAGNAAAAYNHLSAGAAQILAHWNQASGRDDASLGAALAAGSLPDLLSAIPAGGDRGFLLDRLEQFVQESELIVPALARAITAADAGETGALARRSHELAKRCLGNQVPQTNDLAELARGHGAFAASGFGAGFGGAVWALVERGRAARFLDLWRAAYRARYPELAARSQFFLSGAGPSAFELPAGAVPRQDGGSHENPQP